MILNLIFYWKYQKKTFRPIYKENWKEESEKINNVEFVKHRSFFAEYLRYYLKI